MKLKNLTDGMVLDHVAEFMYYPSPRLRQLYAADRVGYVDALCKFIQIVALTDQFVMGPNPPNDEMGRLKEALGDVVDEEAFGDADGTPDQRRVEGLRFLRQNWDHIDSTLLSEHLSAMAMAGHIQREFYRCFMIEKNKRQSMDHYVDPEDALPLAPSNMNLFLRSLDRVVEADANTYESSFLEMWIRRTVTTHYRIFAEYYSFYRHQYAPAGTRSQLPVLAMGNEEEMFATLSRCIAIDILKKLKRRGDRHDLVKVVLDWRANRTSEAVRKGYSDLVDKFMLSPIAPQGLIDEVNGILETDKGYKIDLVVGSATALKRTVALQEAKSSKAMGTHKALRWLYSIRSPNAANTLFELVDDLISSP